MHLNNLTQLIDPKKNPDFLRIRGIGEKGLQVNLGVHGRSFFGIKRANRQGKVNVFVASAPDVEGYYYGGLEFSKTKGNALVLGRANSTHLRATFGRIKHLYHSNLVDLDKIWVLSTTQLLFRFKSPKEKND